MRGHSRSLSAASLTARGSCTSRSVSTKAGACLYSRHLRWALTVARCARARVTAPVSSSRSRLLHRWCSTCASYSACTLVTIRCSSSPGTATAPSGRQYARTPLAPSSRPTVLRQLCQCGSLLSTGLLLWLTRLAVNHWSLTRPAELTCMLSGSARSQEPGARSQEPGSTHSTCTEHQDQPVRH